MKKVLIFGVLVVMMIILLVGCGSSLVISMKSISSSSGSFKIIKIVVIGLIVL